MLLKSKKVDQDVTEIIISEFEEENLWNIMPKNCKNHKKKKKFLKDCLSYLE